MIRNLSIRDTIFPEFSGVGGFSPDYGGAATGFGGVSVGELGAGAAAPPPVWAQTRPSDMYLGFLFSFLHPGVPNPFTGDNVPNKIFQRDTLMRELGLDVKPDKSPPMLVAQLNGPVYTLGNSDNPSGTAFAVKLGTSVEDGVLVEHWLVDGVIRHFTKDGEIVDAIVPRLPPSVPAEQPTGGTVLTTSSPMYPGERAVELVMNRPVPPELMPIANRSGAALMPPILGRRPSRAALTEEMLYWEMAQSGYSGIAVNYLLKYYDEQFDWSAGNLRSLLLRRAAAFATASSGQWRNKDWLNSLGNGFVAYLDMAGVAIFAGDSWKETTKNIAIGLSVSGVLGVIGGVFGGANVGPKAMVAGEGSSLGPQMPKAMVADEGSSLGPQMPKAMVADEGSSLGPQMPKAALADEWAGTFSDKWAYGGADALAAEARASATRSGTITPSWAVTPKSQSAWKSIRITELTPIEEQLVQDVLDAPEVAVGRSINIIKQGQFVLDDWIIERGITWTQRLQNVYNRALYLRTAGGRPVNIISGGGYALGEVTASEAGARVSGIRNRLFWREPEP